MPCYCNIPDEKDQEEIERRCKVSMYFYAQRYLTIEQVRECEKQELKQFPLDDENNHLCKLCKILTKEQMEEISAYWYQIKWKHETLYDWYVQHCIDDEKHNEKQ